MNKRKIHVISTTLSIKILIPLVLALINPAAFAADCSQADIVLNFQEDVDSFQTDYGGGSSCDTITGNLLIEGAIDNDGNQTVITSLDGLNALTTVNGNLTINYGDNPADNFRQVSLNSLAGLENLSIIGGDFEIFGQSFTGGACNTDLNDISALATLSSVAGSLDINCHSNLASCQVLRPLLDQIDDANAGPGPGVAGIPDIGGGVTLAKNACGCNSVAEILNTISVNDVAEFEGDSDTTDFNFTVEISNAVACDLSVTVKSEDDTALLSDNDYLEQNQVLTFRPNEPLQQTVSVSVNGDNIVEPDEIFKILLSDITGPATITDGEGIGTIENDDVAMLTLDIAETEMNEQDGSSMVTVTRNSDLDEALTVFITSGDDSAVSVPATVTIDANEISTTFTINAVDDDLAEENQVVAILAAQDGLLPDTDTITVIDNDPAALTLTLDPTGISEPDGNSQATISRNTADNSEALTVMLSVDDDTQVTLPEQVIIPADSASVDFVISVIDNDLADGERVINITADADDFAGDTEMLTINNEDPARLILTTDEVVISEDGGIAVATVRRNTPTTELLQVIIDNSDSSEVMVPSLVPIAAGQNSASFNIIALNDGEADGNQTLTITVSVAADLLESSSVNILVTDIPSEQIFGDQFED